MLEDRDYTLIIDRSGSMSTKDQENGRSRWDIMQESTFAFASKCEEFDPDGITIYTFSSGFRRYDLVTASKVNQIFKEYEPLGRTDLAKVLCNALQNYFQRKEAGQAKPKGEMILVVTDGEPDDRKAVMTTIIEATRRIDIKEELAIFFIQIGNESKATEFLKLLDNELENAGAKFDIVKTMTLQEIEEQDLSLKDILIKAITD